MIKHMKTYSVFVSICLAVLLCSTVLSAQWQNPDQVPGVILVKFKQGQLHQVNQNLNLADIKAKSIRTLFTGKQFRAARKIFRRSQPGLAMAKARNGRFVDQIDVSHWYRIQLDEGTDIDAMVEELKKDQRIEKVSASYYYYEDDLPAPNDQYFGLQLGLKQGTTGKDIHVLGAWMMNKGNSNVKIAVIDSGLDLDHSDLDPGDRSRVIAGFDTADNDSTPEDDTLNPSGHGTKVAGVIGAITNNISGVAGIMWNVKIIPVKAKQSSTGTYDDSDIADAVDWAVNNGADIINMSLSSTRGTNNPIHDAVNNANSQGVLVVCAMGNNDYSTTRYPAGYAATFAVGATDETDKRFDDGWGSNWGNHIDVVAPGSENHNYSTTLANGYDEFGGTSCATPMVVGTAGLILSESMDRGLNLDHDDIKHILRASADKVRTDLYTYDSKGWNSKMGYGRINANEALEMIQAPNSILHGTVYGGTSQLTWGTHNHVFFSNIEGGMASGVYSVKQYKVSTTITFPDAYFSPPQVWIRNTNTKSWSAANPNYQKTFATASNITNTSASIDAYIYYVYGGSGWRPCSASQVRVDYTVMGEKLETPSNLTATLADPLRITLNWTDRSSSESGFKIEKKAGSSGTWTQVATVGPNVTTYNYDDFPYNIYYFRVRAYKYSTDSAYSNTVSIDPWHGYISGPSSLDFKQQGTFTAHPDGASYEWRYRYNGTGSWSSVTSTSQTITRTMIFDDFELQCKITKGDRTVYDTQYVTYGIEPW